MYFFRTVIFFSCLFCANSFQTIGTKCSKLHISQIRNTDLMKRNTVIDPEIVTTITNSISNLTPEFFEFSSRVTIGFTGTILGIITFFPNSMMAASGTDRTIFFSKVAIVASFLMFFGGIFGFIFNNVILFLIGVILQIFALIGISL